MSLADVTSARSSPTPENCPECDATASVTSDLHKYQVACTCKPGSVQYACADDPGPPPPAKTDTPPALPPRPPTSVLASNRRTNASAGCSADTSCRRRKYAWWCCGCGALAAALGGLLAAQHILVRAYTASPHHLETVPAAVPAAMLVLTGVCIMSLARRRNRYSYMIKVVGACCLMCALTCVLVTITTTVIHMNKLQTLKFCEYTKLTRTCTCFSMPPDTQHAGEDEGVRCVFEGVSECGVVHGALYWCLRGVFALSVSAVLVCIFSCMLAYQLLSHERKKMYWEQLELRCRSLYRPPSGQPAPTAGRAVQNTCSCCTACHGAAGWELGLQPRLWAPGRAGNLYSPNPGAARKHGAWSWFPWPRSNSQNSRCQMGVPQSGDSAYGFCDETPTANPQPYEDRAYPQNYPQNTPQTYPYPANQNFTPGFPISQGFGQYPEGYPECSGSFDAQTGVWGPPPPYSPQGRNGSRHHLHQDPATATLLHHHHIEVHRNDDHHSCRNYHEHEQNPINQERITDRMNPMVDRLQDRMNQDRLNQDRLNQDCRMNQIDCRMNQDSRLNPINQERINPDCRMNQDSRMNPDSRMTQLNQEVRLNQERMNPDCRMIQDPRLIQDCRMNQDRNPDHLNQDIRMKQELRDGRIINPEISRINPEISRINPEMIRINPEINRINQEMSRINPEITRINPEMSRMKADRLDMAHMMYPDDIEMTQIQDGRFNTLRGHLVPYRCQRMDMSAGNIHRECRIEDPMTIECLHQKSVSKVSDQSSDSCQKQGKENLGFQNDKHSPIRSSMQDCPAVNQNAESEVYFADVSSCCNVSVKADCCINPNVSLVGTIENHPESTSESESGSFTLTRQQRPQPQVGSKRRPNKHKPEKRQNNSLRLTEHQIEQLNLRMNERNDGRMNDRCERDRLNDSIRLNDSRERIGSRDRLSDSRNELDRMNDSRISDRMNETRLSERICDRNDCRLERMNDSRISERMNDSRIDRLNDSRLNDSRIERMNDSRISDRMNEPRHCERMTDPRLNDSRISRISDCLNERMNETRDRERKTDLNPSFNEGSPKIRTHISPLRVPLPRTSPKNLPKDHPRQNSSDGTKPDFFLPPPPVISPLSPNTEESLLSDDDRQDIVYSNDPESSKCLAPDSQYEAVRDDKELKTNHHHCYSDTNTMDSGWQSGSEKQVTD